MKYKIFKLLVPDARQLPQWYVHLGFKSCLFITFLVWTKCVLILMMR